MKLDGMFKEGEDCLNKTRGIHNISSHSLSVLFTFYQNLDKKRYQRWRNWNTLKDLLSWCHLKINPDFPSFFPLLVDRRDELREWLKQYNIFLPVHWPKHPKAPDNPLYDYIISIPVDLRYHEADMRRVADKVNEFYGYNFQKENMIYPMRRLIGIKAQRMVLAYGEYRDVLLKK